MSRFGPNVNLADVTVEITARNDLLQRQLGQAEQMVKASTSRMDRIAGGFGGLRGITRGIRGGILGPVALAGAAAPAGLRALELNMELFKGVIAGLQGDFDKVRKSMELVRASAERFVSSIPLIGPVLDNIGETFAEIIDRQFIGMAARTERALIRQQQAEAQIERIERTRGADPTTFSAQLAGGGRVNLATNVVFNRDTLGRQTASLEQIQNTVTSIQRTIENLRLVFSQ